MSEKKRLDDKVEASLHQAWIRENAAIEQRNMLEEKAREKTKKAELHHKYFKELDHQ
jgi:hypothetical protein